MAMESLLKQMPGPVQKVDIDHFHFISKGKVERKLQVLRFHGEERVNAPYEIDIEVVAPQSIDPFSTLEEQLLGHPSSLVMMDSGDVPRVIHGVVTAYDVLGSLSAESVRIRLRLSARLNLLK